LSLWLLLAGLLVGNPSSGAFVSLAQATLMDDEPDARERNMARWTLAGSVGYVSGPLLIAAAGLTGLGWRGVLGLWALPAVPLALAVRPAPSARERPDWRGFLAALRDLEVLRWLGVLEASGLLLDVFHGFLALYAVDVAGVSPAGAALVVAVWT